MCYATKQYGNKKYKESFHDQNKVPWIKKNIPMTAKPMLTNHKLFRLVKIDMAPMAIAIWNMVTPRENTSCLATCLFDSF